MSDFDKILIKGAAFDSVTELVHIGDNVRLEMIDHSLWYGVVTRIYYAMGLKDIAIDVQIFGNDIGNYTFIARDILRCKVVSKSNPKTDVKSSNSMVDHPNHYQSEAGLEVIDVIEAFTAKLTGIEASDTANVIKYICRWKEKNGVQDLEKAKWYLEHLINHVNKTEKEN